MVVELDKTFSPQVVRSICSVSARQLDYWIDRGLIAPATTPAEDGRRLRRYSFRDILLVRTIAELRRTGVSVEKIRMVVDRLAEASESLTDAWIVTDGAEVYRVMSPDVVEVMSSQSAQMSFGVIVMSQLTEATEHALIPFLNLETSEGNASRSAATH